MEKGKFDREKLDRDQFRKVSFTEINLVYRDTFDGFMV